MRGERELRELAARQGNHVNARQAREIGLTSHEFRRLESTGRWAQVTDRVLRLIGGAPARGERLFAAVLDQGSDASVAAMTAAWWWNLPGFSPHDPILVTTASTAWRTSLATVHQVRSLPTRWLTNLDHLPVVRPELMALQLCAAVHPDRASRALDNAWNNRLLSGRSIDALLSDLGKRGRNGTALLRQLRDIRPNDYIPPASNLERRATEVLGHLGLDLARQVDSGGDQLWTGRVDLRDRRLPLIIEVQSERHHSALLDQEADARRRATFEADGYVFIDVTDTEIWTDPESARDRVRRAVRDLRAARQSS